MCIKKIETTKRDHKWTEGVDSTMHLSIRGLVLPGLSRSPAGGRCPRAAAVPAPGRIWLDWNWGLAQTEEVRKFWNCSISFVFNNYCLIMD
jgi:hypothetical protein